MAEQTTQRPGWHLDDASWHFFARAETRDEHAALRWSWRAVASNGVTWVGDEDFATLPLCRTDATKHGFVEHHSPPPS